MEIRIDFAVDDEELSRLIALAFGADMVVQPWAERLAQHALCWIGAFSDDRLTGFVQVSWDGGAHAFLLDAVVDPGHGRQGIGGQLVKVAAEQARAAGCVWLHVDYEPHLAGFYVEGCGFRPTHAALLRLTEAVSDRPP